MTVSLTYDSYGDAKDPAVVLIHPFPFRAAFWAEVAPIIADAGYFVVAPNLRGCATSPLGEDEPSMELLASDVWSLLDSLNINRPFVLGVSLGGYVTLAMLRARPLQIAGIGLIDTKATADSPAAVRNRKIIAHEIHNDLSTEEYAQQMLPTLLSTYTHERRLNVVDQVREWITSNDPHTVSWLQHAMAARPDSTEALAAFSGPVLLIRGEDDVVSKPQDFEHMHNTAQHPTMVIATNCAHLPPVEDPGFTSQTIVNWLTETNQ